MDIDKRFIGYEFDWFAVDKEGQIGFFSSGGYGVIPDKVKINYKEYDNISTKIEMPNSGNKNIWKDIASYGLYVFDWDQNKNSYIKLENPTKKIDEALQKEILEIRDLSYFNEFFYEVEYINP